MAANALSVSGLFKPLQRYATDLELQIAMSRQNPGGRRLLAVLLERGGNSKLCV